MSTEPHASWQSYEYERKRAVILATGRLYFMLPTLEKGHCYGCSARGAQDDHELCDALTRSRGTCAGTETVFVRASDIGRYRIEAVTRKLK